MGFHKIAKYYYYPTFAEPTGVMEVMINKNAFAELPSDLQAIVKQAVAACNIDMLSEFEAKNAEYLEKIRTETKVMVKSFPDDVVEVFRKYANEALEELATSDAFSKKCWTHTTRLENQLRAGRI
jgi:TRAP-type mannitol/chloroaromatic compound transport system substrate-binding protein